MAQKTAKSIKQSTHSLRNFQKKVVNQGINQSRNQCLLSKSLKKSGQSRNQPFKESMQSLAGYEKQEINQQKQKLRELISKTYVD